MKRLSPLDAAFLVVTAGVWTAILLQPEPWIDRFFGIVMLTSLVALLRLGALAWLAARQAGRHAADVSRVLPDEVAARAVEEERARLGTDIVLSLRESLAVVAVEIEAVSEAADPLPGLRRIQAQTRRATSELRRQLGLLRTPSTGSEPIAREEAGAHRPVRPRRRELVVAAAVTLLAAAEATAYLVTEGFGEGASPTASVPLSVVLSMVAAASIALRRASPVVGAVWCAAAFAAGTLVGSPLTGGFWAVATVGSLTWALAARAAAALGTGLAWLALAGSIVHSRLVDDRDNAFIFGLLIAVVTVVGVAVRLGRRRGERAAARARTHEQALQTATSDAVRRERQQFAREIHDVVSHAVGLVAMQAAAAEVSWPHRPEVVAQAVEVIRSTTESTMVEVDRMVPGAGDRAGPPRLEELVARIRRCGMAVELRREGVLPDELAPLAYRIAQEGLTNALRHAPGSRVVVAVLAGADGLTVTVEDDGPGPDVQHQPGYGLVGVDERVSMLGGSVEAGPGPGGRGFRLRAHVPHVREGVVR